MATKKQIKDFERELTRIIKSLSSERDKLESLIASARDHCDDTQDAIAFLDDAKEMLSRLV